MEETGSDIEEFIEAEKTSVELLGAGLAKSSFLDVDVSQ